MAQIKQILQIESERSEENRNVVHLFQEGTFYRAYNWSAWLCHRFVQQFKVTHKQLKGIDESVLFVGFPVSSIERYFGTCTMHDVDEKSKDVYLLTDIVSQDMDINIMKTDFGNWKSSIPLTISKTKVKENDAESAPEQSSSHNLPRTITAIMQQILSFPLEHKTPIECMLFVAETKQNLARLI